MIGLETLKKEREALKKKLAEVEAEGKEMDAKVRNVRQREIQTKREIEALSVLIELQETKGEDCPRIGSHAVDDGSQAHEPFVRPCPVPA